MIMKSIEKVCISTLLIKAPVSKVVFAAGMTIA